MLIKSDHIDIAIPDLKEGFEGPDAERDAAMHNCGPAEPWAREVYERWQAEKKTLKLPEGWSCSVNWCVSGRPVLTLQGPRSEEAFEDRGTTGAREVWLQASATMAEDGRWMRYDQEAQTRKPVIIGFDLVACATPRRTLGTSPAAERYSARVADIDAILNNIWPSHLWAADVPDYNNAADLSQLMKAAARMLEYGRGLNPREVEVVSRVHRRIHEIGGMVLETAKALWADHEPRMLDASVTPSTWVPRLDAPVAA